MGFSVFANSGRRAYGIKDFIVDTPSDIKNLSVSYTPGCMAFVISDSTYYMLNHQKKWIKIKASSGGGGGSSTDPSSEDSTDIQDAIWDGGNMDGD